MDPPATSPNRFRSSAPTTYYDRKPCDGPHTGARLAGVVNVLAMLALIGGWIWISRRTRTEAFEQLTVPEAVTR